MVIIVNGLLCRRILVCGLMRCARRTVLVIYINLVEFLNFVLFFIVIDRITPRTSCRLTVGSCRLVVYETRERKCLQSVQAV